ncbi:unnamed protein product [Ilex paraguariensis]|uniref:Uncharacterized protein n=1 Tax=Ilex paraguariensis TaxID=185542 RepID=A0ABC8RUQ9_9AQUA
MGCIFSKRRTHPPPKLSSDSQMKLGLISYMAACRANSDHESLNSKPQQRTTRVISTIAGGVQIRSLSLYSLREVPGYLLENNEEVVNAVLGHKKEIWENPELVDLVKDYFESSPSDRQAIVQAALNQFDEEHTEGFPGEKSSYSKTLPEFKNIQVAADSFDDEFFSSFQSVYQRQWKLLHKLQVEKDKLDRKLNSKIAWRKASNVLFGVTFVAVLICSVVAAAMSAPPVVTALAAAASASLGSTGKWLDSTWTNCVKVIEEQKEIIRLIHVHTEYYAIEGLKTIGELVNKLEELKSLWGVIDHGLKKEAAVVMVVNEISKKQDVFVRTVGELTRNYKSQEEDL